MNKHICAGLAVVAVLVGCSPSGSRKGMPAQAEGPPVSLGEPGNATDVAVTVRSVEEKRRFAPAGMGPEAGPAETFVIVRYAIKNTSRKPLSSVDRPAVTLVDGNGQGYSEDSQTSIVASGINNDIQDALADINPNVSAKVTAVWKVDKAAFDRATWKLRVATEPQLTFALK